jgi:hypothetical protein
MLVFLTPVSGIWTIITSHSTVPEGIAATQCIGVSDHNHPDIMIREIVV